MFFCWLNLFLVFQWWELPYGSKKRCFTAVGEESVQNNPKIMTNCGPFRRGLLGQENLCTRSLSLGEQLPDYTYVQLRIYKRIHALISA